MKLIVTIYLCAFCMICHGQSIDKLILRGDYSSRDSIQVTRAYLNANRAVDKMYIAMKAIWTVGPRAAQSKKCLRKERWGNDAAFMTWLGQPEKMRMAFRRIRKIHAKYKRKIFIEVTKENKGSCNRWTSAWTIPFGKVKIRLCESYFKYRTNLHEKTLIHELGHEAGMLLDRKIHSCWRAQRAAGSRNKNIAKKSPENYAWLAMSYLGLQCSY